MKKQSGFTLIELMIVVAIVAILAAIALPAYQTYTKKARFTEVVSATGPYKTAIEVCVQTYGVSSATDLTSTTITGTGHSCVEAGQNGIPAAITSGTGNVGSVSISNAGVITAVGSGSAGTANFTLTPTVQSDSHINWTRSGSCMTDGSCS